MRTWRVVTGKPPGNPWEGLGLVLLATRARAAEVRSPDGRLPQVFLLTFYAGEEYLAGKFRYAT